MSWGNPIAWVGMLALALPVLVHLLSRMPPEVRAFPSLRFLAVSPLLPRRRMQPRDVLLLVVRCLAIATAVAALARPMIRATTTTATARAARASRAVVLDTSASVVQNGVTRDSAAHTAAQLAAEAATAMIMPTANPADALEGAAAWLATQRGPHELVVVSDFQRGAVDEQLLRAIPRPFGVRLVRVPGTLPPDSFSVSIAMPGVQAHVAQHDSGSVFSWTRTADSSAALTIDGATTIRDASGAHTVHIEYAAANAKTDASDTVPPRAAWMADLLVRLHEHATLAEVAQEVVRLNAARADSATRATTPRGFVVARAANNAPLVTATQQSTSGDTLLLLRTSATENSALGRALLLAVRAAIGTQVPMTERAAVAIPDSALQAWSRAATDSGAAALSSNAPDADGDSLGRWMWAAALLLLGVEWLVRRMLDRRAMAAA